MKRVLITIMAFAVVLAGCASVTKMGAQLGQGAGVLTEQQTASISRTADAWNKAAQDIMPEQEYFIGRAVAASLMNQYPALDDSRANAYLNRIGQTLAMASDRPETFGGYHFLLLDSDEINAFAAPGGLILVSRGLVNLCSDEDELAAVLAHEIAHVQNRDGLMAIDASRDRTKWTTLGVEAARHLGTDELRELAGDFDESIGDIVDTVADSGYARNQEHQADLDALVMLERVGYSAQALKRMLNEMEKRWDPSGLGFARTHPSPTDRLEAINTELSGSPTASTSSIRAKRFATALAGISNS